MARVKTQFFVISCSSDGDVNQRFLYVHGERKHHSLPTMRNEARKRLLNCQEEMKCDACDAEIHQCLIRREKKTLKQKNAGEEVNNA